jgi:hypothetical protein
MTQPQKPTPPKRPRPLPKTVQPYHPRTGERVLLTDTDMVGLVIDSDEWWDTLLLRGVDIADQVLVDWGPAPETSTPIIRWEPVNRLKPVPSDPSATPETTTTEEGEA